MTELPPEGNARIREVLFNALDVDFNTYWLADPSSGNTTLKVTFGKTTDLAGIRFSVGATADAYASIGRPKQVEVIFLGTSQPVPLTLTETSEPRCSSRNVSGPVEANRTVTRLPKEVGSERSSSTS